MDEPLRASDVSKLNGLEEWRILLRTLQTSYRTGSFRIGIDLAARIGEASNRANHHPDLQITSSRVHVTLTTHESGGITNSDVELARTISTIALELAATAEPSAVTQLEVAVDALDIPAVKPCSAMSLIVTTTPSTRIAGPQRSGFNRCEHLARNATASISM